MNVVAVSQVCQPATHNLLRPTNKEDVIKWVMTMKGNSYPHFGQANKFWLFVAKVNASFKQDKQ